MLEKHDDGFRREHRYYRNFLVYTSIAVSLVVLALFVGISVRVKHLFDDSVLSQARTHFQNILITRAWNSSYGGVYVEKLPGMDSVTYQDFPDIACEGGKVLTIKPPAVMTKEISGYADRRGLFFYSITSLDPLNPENAPDGFEREAFESFEGGAREYYREEDLDGRRYFRYMAPLIADGTCLRCHAAQGYSVGDIRGGISVNIDVEHRARELSLSFGLVIVLGIVSALLMLAVIFFFASKMIRQIDASRARIEELIITDELTGIHNRRHLLARFEEEFDEARRLGTQLGCVMFDIDRFKRINDTHGHLAGDEVLLEFSAFLKKVVRTYDVVGRLGGEEFLVVLPASNYDVTWKFAERVRSEVEGMEFPFEQAKPISMTVSAGVAVLEEGDKGVLDFLNRADEAMYRAKDAGRNKVS
jgi:diguanylate cyclase (GGDEF)-like protein